MTRKSIHKNKPLNEYGPYEFAESELEKEKEETHDFGSQESGSQESGSQESFQVISQTQTEMRDEPFILEKNMKYSLGKLTKEYFLRDTGKKRKLLISSYECAELLVNESSLGIQLRIYPRVDLMYMYYPSLGYYREINSHQLGMWIHSMLKDLNLHTYLSTNYIKSVVSDLKYNVNMIDHMDEEPISSLNYLVFDNGTLNLHTGELMKWTPNIFVTSGLHYSYNPEATCNEFCRFLADICENHEDRMLFLRAYLNALIHSRVDLQIFLYMLGPGGTGKTQFSLIATALVGKEGTLTTSLKSLSGDHFELSNLQNKKLILISEAEDYTGDLSILKALVGNDALKGRIKHVSGSREINPAGLVLIVGNNPLQIKDTSNAINRRMRVFKTFLSQQKSLHIQPSYGETRKPLIYYTQNGWKGPLAPELPGIFNYVSSMDRKQVEEFLINTKRNVLSFQEVFQESEVSLNPLIDWTEQELEEGIGSYVGYVQHESMQKSYLELSRRHILYPTFLQWLKRQGITNMKFTHKNFTSALIEVLVNKGMKCEKVKKREGSYITGVVLKPHVYLRDKL